MTAKNAAEIDKNFAVNSSIDKSEFNFYSAEELSVHGVTKIDGIFRRMRYEDAKRVSENVALISTECAGGRCRFATDSERVAILVKYRSVAKVSNYSYTATLGFDLYTGGHYVGCFVPPQNTADTLEGVINTENVERKMRVYTLNFPVCSEICELYVGIDKGAQMESASEYSISKPIVFYGSSTTQGACASRPGNTYENMISRALDCDYINLGFWGNALGEVAMAEYIASLDMSVFVYDYDYNSPSAEHLEKTHEKMFKIIREKNPELPIIMLSAPKCELDKEFKKRVAIIKRTYKNAIACGDKHVKFMSGRAILKGIEGVALADNIHPGDMGFSNIAKCLIKEIKKMLPHG